MLNTPGGSGELCRKVCDTACSRNNLALRAFLGGVCLSVLWQTHEEMCATRFELQTRQVSNHITQSCLSFLAWNVAVALGSLVRYLEMLPIKCVGRCSQEQVLRGSSAAV